MKQETLKFRDGDHKRLTQEAEAFGFGKNVKAWIIEKVLRVDYKPDFFWDNTNIMTKGQPTNSEERGNPKHVIDWAKRSLVEMGVEPKEPINSKECSHNSWTVTKNKWVCADCGDIMEKQPSNSEEAILKLRGIEFECTCDDIKEGDVNIATKTHKLNNHD